MNDLTQYIYHRLIEEGFLVKEDDIGMILDLESEYMLEKGFMEIIEDEDD